jgi:hypothetical protein
MAARGQAPGPGPGPSRSETVTSSEEHRRSSFSADSDWHWQFRFGENVHHDPSLLHSARRAAPDWQIAAAAAAVAAAGRAARPGLSSLARITESVPRTAYIMIAVTIRVPGGSVSLVRPASSTAIAS